MAKLRIDLRKVLREIATAVQVENLNRLLSGQAVSGSSLEPKKAPPQHATSRRKRVRIFGIRVALADLVGKLGVRTGALLKDLSRAGNQRIGRTSFKIVPSPDVILRWRVFNKGAGTRQPPRPVSGMTAEQLEKAAQAISAEARNQFVAALRDRVK